MGAGDLRRFRIAWKSFDYRDLHVPWGTMVTIGIGSANRDHRVFGDATFNIEAKRAKPPLTLGHGPHACLGHQFAHVEMEEGFGALATRLRNVKPNGAPVWITQLDLCGAQSLPVRFERRTVP